MPHNLMTRKLVKSPVMIINLRYAYHLLSQLCSLLALMRYEKYEGAEKHIPRYFCLLVAMTCSRFLQLEKTKKEQRFFCFILYFHSP